MSKSVLPIRFLLVLLYYLELGGVAWIHWLFLDDIRHHHIRAFYNSLQDIVVESHRTGQFLKFLDRLLISEPKPYQNLDRKSRKNDFIFYLLVF